VQGVGQGLDVFELERGFAWAVVKNLQGGDFVPVLGDEGFESLDHAASTLGAAALKPASMRVSWVTMSMIWSACWRSCRSRLRRAGWRGV